jgi:hypothetical protein
VCVCVRVLCVCACVCVRVCACVCVQTMKLIEYMYASQLPDIKIIIETFSESVALREQLASNEAKVCTTLY